MNFVHELVGRFAVVGGGEFRGGDVGEADVLLAVEPTQEFDLADAEWAFAVVEDFDGVGVGSGSC